MITPFLSRLEKILADPFEAAPSLSPEEAGALAVRLAQAIPPLLQRARDSHDHLVDADKAAVLLCKGRDWVVRNSEKLPFALKVGDEWRYSDAGIQQYIRDRKKRR